MTALDTIYAMIADHAGRVPEFPAIGAPARKSGGGEMAVSPCYVGKNL